MTAALMVAAFLAVSALLWWRYRTRPRIGVIDARALAMWKALGQTRDCPRVHWLDPEPESPFPYSVRWNGQWIAGWSVPGGDLINIVRAPDEVERAGLAHELVHCTGLVDHDAVFYARVDVALAAKGSA